MHFYTVIFRLDTDSKFSKRRWESFAESRDHAVALLIDYVRENFFPDNLFPPKVSILKMDEYLSIFS